MEISPLTGVLGARVDEVELSPTMLDDLVEELHQALCEHEVLVVPGQDLSPAEQAGFSHLLGGYSPVPFVQPVPEHPEVIKVVKEATEPEAFNFGGVWHSDFSFLDAPPAFTILHALDVPAVGGDTVWASMTAAHNALPAEMRDLFEGVTCVHSASASYSPAQQDLHSGLSGMDIRTSESAEATRDHPLVCTHPETGRRSLFLAANSTTRIVGLSEGESDLLLTFLLSHIQLPEFHCRFRWEPNSIAFWDQRCTVHYAIPDYKEQRTMYRLSIDGDKPR